MFLNQDFKEILSLTDMVLTSSMRQIIEQSNSR